MKLICEIVRDILPLYEDDVCSEETRKAVEEHLKECEQCRNLMANLKEFKEPEVTVEENKESKVVAKTFRKVRHRWAISLIIAIMIPIFAILPAFNYAKGYGITYANLKEIITVYAFTNALIEKDFEKAYGYLDIKTRYEDLIDSMDETDIAVANGIKDIQAKGFDWYNEVCRAKFMENMNVLDEQEEMVASISNSSIFKQSNGGWLVQMNLITESGNSLEMQFWVTDKGITNVSGALNDTELDQLIGEKIEESESAGLDLMYDRLYREPSINETVMKLLYENTDYEWELLFEY